MLIISLLESFSQFHANQVRNLIFKTKSFPFSVGRFSVRGLNLSTPGKNRAFEISRLPFGGEKKVKLKRPSGEKNAAGRNLSDFWARCLKGCVLRDGTGFWAEKRSMKMRDRVGRVPKTTLRERVPFLFILIPGSGEIEKKGQ